MFVYFDLFGSKQDFTVAYSRHGHITDWVVLGLSQIGSKMVSMLLVHACFLLYTPSPAPMHTFVQRVQITCSVYPVLSVPNLGCWTLLRGSRFWVLTWRNCFNHTFKTTKLNSRVVQNSNSVSELFKFGLEHGIPSYMPWHFFYYYCFFLIVFFLENNFNFSANFQGRTQHWNTN